MGTSLNELKTGREKLEIINQVLARISNVATALDNTRIEEIVGLKEQVNNFYNQILELKNLVVKNSELTQSNTDFTKNKRNEIEKISNEIKNTLNNIEEIYNNIIESEKDISDGVNFVKDKYPELNEFNKNFEIIKIKLEEYYNIAVDFNAGLKKIEENKNLTKSYLDLSIELKQQILQELEHAQSIKEDLHSNIELVNKLVSNIVATKNEIISITNNFKNVKSEVQNIVNDAEATIKLKINTILFENQRLNQNMIDLLKRCENLEDEIVGKYEDILKIEDLINSSTGIINDLREAVKQSEQISEDMRSFTAIINDFKTEISNLKADLESYGERLKGQLDLKLAQANSSVDAKISSIETLKNQIEAYVEANKNTVDVALANFIERSKIANEDLGRLAEVARTELANDKTAIESYLLELKQSMVNAMKKVSSDITDETSGILAQKNQIELIITQGKSDLDTLINNFNSNYQNKLNEFNSNTNEKLASINSLSEESITNIQNKTDENISRLDTASEEKLTKFDEIIKDNLGEIYSHIFSIENVLMDKKIIKLSYKE
ncbi:hypothetical protein [Campylobacter coli]|uniref:hypothetical protein n=1 Tax=Campylobacter coli TaxID=195 RepID=UPI000257EFD7|nr:hypothetical protein [Campylobacter coli]EAK3347270.1 hypothetical protein [Campylobacter coli]EIB14643.1 hypothetical protein cco99_07918 [Campylobacter coli Z156]MDP8504392.1 hypothetical protein [Campylobacter coli]OEY46828.1 hypothetical protein A0L24_08365 [Campylobacter coli]